MSGPVTKFGPFLDGFIEVNGVDLSDHCESFTLTQGQESLDNHAMGDQAAYQRAGLMTWNVEANFFQDFSAGNVNATLYPLLSGTETFAVRVKPTSSATSATNPLWSGQAFISSYNPLGGSHGDNLMSPCTFTMAGDIFMETS